MRYLKGTANIDWTFFKNKVSVSVVVYVDFDYYIATLFDSVINWKATLQFVVTLSITETEYIPIIEAMKEVIWLQHLASDLGLVQ